MERRHQAKVVLFAIGVGILVISLAFIASVIQRNLAPDDSSAAVEDLMALRVLGSNPTANVAVGSNFQVGVFANLAGKSFPNSDLSVTELKINFDKNKLQVTDIVPFDSVNTLSLNKQLNNTSGFVTLDISTTGDTKFTGNVQLATITFSVLTSDYKTGTVAFGPETTLGLPNVLTTADRDTPMPYPTASSSVATTTAVSITNVMKLRMVNPTTLRDFLPGEQIQVGVYADLAGKNIPGSVSMSVAELRVNFDPQSLEVTNIVAVDSNDLSLNKVLQNTSGYVTLDLSKTGGANYTGNVHIATITFTVDQITSNRLTNITFGNETTLGIPNILAAGSLTDKLELSLKRPSSSSSATTSVVSSSRTSSAGSSSRSSSSASSSRSSSAISSNNSSKISSTGTSSIAANTSSSNTTKTTSIAANTTRTSSRTSVFVNPQTTANQSSQAPLVCTTEVLGCPDGTFIGRNPNNNCQYDLCPISEPSSSESSFSSASSKPSSADQILACNFDYDGSGIVDAGDFGVFALNYNQDDIDCSLDVFGNDCYLDDLDFQMFSSVYLSYLCAD